MAGAPLPSEKSRLIFQRDIKRGRYVRRLFRQVLGFLAVLGAYFAVGEAAARGVIAGLTVDIGRLAAIVLGGLFVVRAGSYLFYALTRRSEELRFYSKGFVWVRGKEAFKYPYPELVRYREGGRGLYIGMRPLVQWGAHTLEMRDGEVFRVRPRHGSLKRFADRVRPHAANVTAIQIGQTLRAGRPVQLHRNLTVYPGGVEIGRHEVRWVEMAVLIRRNSLIIQRYSPKRKKFRRVKRFWIPHVDNVGGFYDLAQGTIRNHRERRQAAAQKPQRIQPIGT